MIVYTWQMAAIMWQRKKKHPLLVTEVYTVILSQGAADIVLAFLNILISTIALG